MAWNSRVDHVAPFRVMHLLEMAQAREAAGFDVIHLEVGEPDFATPEPIIAAGQQALVSGHTRYTPAAGLPALREAIAGHYAEHFNATVDPARILVTPGASGALLLASQLLVESGSRVLMAPATATLWPWRALRLMRSPWGVIAVGSWTLPWLPSIGVTIRAWQCWRRPPTPPATR